MEDAVEALKMAFAVIVFCIALTISIAMFTQAKSTSDIILAEEGKNDYYEYYTYNRQELKENVKRVVGLETVIPTLYKYYKENYTVVFKTGTYENGQLTNVRNYELYTSKTPDKTSDNKPLWGNYDWRKYWGENASETYKRKICSFDMDEEIKRREPWTSSQSDVKNNLDLFLNGGKFISPTGLEAENMNYGNGFINAVTNNGTRTPRFVEELGEYVYERNNDEGGTVDSSGGTTITIDGETTSLLRKNKKRVITYILIN